MEEMMNTLMNIVNQLQENQDKILKMNEDLKIDIEGLKKDTEDIRLKLNNLNEEVNNIKPDENLENKSEDDIATIKKDMIPLKQGMVLVINDLNEVKGRFSNFEAFSYSMDTKAANISENFFNATNQLNEISNLINQVSNRKIFKNIIDEMYENQKEIIGGISDLKRHFAISEDETIKMKSRIIRTK